MPESPGMAMLRVFAHIRGSEVVDSDSVERGHGRFTFGTLQASLCVSLLLAIIKL